jgi:hypothetical protein
VATEWIRREVLRNSRRYWGYVSLSLASGGIGLLMNGFVHNMPHFLTIALQVIGALLFLLAVVCFLAYRFYNRLSS